jgi:hypothetical protein
MGLSDEIDRLRKEREAAEAVANKSAHIAAFRARQGQEALLELALEIVSEMKAHSVSPLAQIELKPKRFATGEYDVKVLAGRAWALDRNLLISEDGLVGFPDRSWYPGDVISPQDQRRGTYHRKESVRLSEPLALKRTLSAFNVIGIYIGIHPLGVWGERPSGSDGQDGWKSGVYFDGERLMEGGDYSVNNYGEHLVGLAAKAIDRPGHWL